MKNISFILFFYSFLNGFAQQSVPSPYKKDIYQDIYQDETDDNLIFGNSQFRLEFNRKSGAWVGLFHNNVPNNLIKASRLADTFDFQVDGKAVLDNGLPSLRDAFTRTNEGDESVTFSMIFRIKNSTNQFIEFQIYYKIYAKDTQLERFAAIRRVAMNNTLAAETGFQRPHFEQISFKIPYFQIGSSKDCFFDIPGSFSAETFVAPSTPFDSLRNKKMQFLQAPDNGLGILSMSNPSAKVSCGIWLNTKGEVAYRPYLEGKGQAGIILGQNNLRSIFFDENSVVNSDSQHLVFRKNPKEIFDFYQNRLTKTYPIAATPAWVDNMILLEVYPKYFQGGFKEITDKLSFYKNIGFNTVYLMPHAVGGYMPVDLYEVNPDYGSKNDLKNLVRVAHSLDMKVIFNVTIHGFSEASDLTRKNPQLFVHNEDGKFAKHPILKSTSTNWANADYQQYMADLAMHDVLEYDIDGYKIDGVDFKGAGWDSSSPLPAYKSGTGSQEIMQRMQKAMRVSKPNAVVFSEANGVIFYGVSNIVPDNMAETPQLLVELLQKGKYSASDYKKQLAMTYATLPKGANRLFFTRNHDTSSRYHFNGYNEHFKTFDAVHTFFGIPGFFAGDPDHEPNPDTEIMDYYKKLYDFKKNNEELSTGDIFLNEVRCDNPNVFTGIRQENRTSLVMISMSEKIEDTIIEIPDNFPNQIIVTDVISSEKTKINTTSKSFRVQLKPFQVLVARW